MRLSLTCIFLAGFVALVPGLASAAQWQHDAPEANTICSSCHSLYVRSVENISVFDSACINCHGQRTAHGAPWTTADQAVPGVSGKQHNWSGAAVNPAAGANINYLPDSARAMLVAGKLQCTVCHNPHVSEGTPAPSSMRTSIPVGVPQAKTGNVGTGDGSATLTLSANPGSPAVGFRIKIQSVDAGGGTFILSHVPGGRDGTWLTWSGSAWAYNLATTPGRPYQNGVAVGTDTAGVDIAISAGAAEGDYWDFYVGYPFVRITNLNDGACFNCHKERVMNHTRARGLDTSYLPNGVRKFSHPVGVSLNTNATYTDRPVILDVDGTAGSSATDGAGNVSNPTNDVGLMANGKVGCTSCHSVHNADSNSYTVDPR
jgi:hypothetical protein